MNKRLIRLQQRIIQIKTNNPVKFRNKINTNKFTINPEYD